MCGIAGVLARSPDPVVSRAAVRLTAALAHRGPDGEGFWADTDPGRGRLSRDRVPEHASLVLGHRRLSIIDLTTGDQPLSDEDGNVWTSFNGEIFNYRELRSELESSGHRFATQADTEVLVHGWQQWGVRLLERLNGIFAFALSDRKQNVTLLARDPIGVKPLYLGISKNLTWWSSELHAAREAGLIADTLSPEALKLYFMFRFIPSPAAVFEGTWKVPPGHYVLLRSGDAGRSPAFESYVTTQRSDAVPRGRAAWREALMTEFEAAVRRQLMSDVPVGSLLSGGLDSSVVTLLMKRHLPYQPHAFGIGFTADGELSEARLGSAAACELGVPFTASEIEDGDYFEGWREACKGMGEPIANPGGVLVHRLCCTVAQSHKVVLSGQGADEPLGGYPRHMAERLRPVGLFAPRASAWVAERLLGGDAGARLGRILGAPETHDRYLEIFAVVEPELVDLLIPTGAAAREVGRAAIARWIAPGESGDPLNDLLRADTRMSLADDLLTVADHFSMMASVELRVPFLDLQFLELVERMPSRYKVSALGERKWLFRQAAAPLLPPALARKVCGLRARLGRKMGFTAPVAPRNNGGLIAPQDRAQWLTQLGELDLLSMPTVSSLLLGERLPSQRTLTVLSSLAHWFA